LAYLYISKQFQKPSNKMHIDIIYVTIKC